MSSIPEKNKLISLLRKDISKPKDNNSINNVQQQRITIMWLSPTMLLNEFIPSISSLCHCFKSKASFFHSFSAFNPSMADNFQTQDLPVPPVLVLGHPTCFPALQPQYSHKFQFLNPTPSRLPLHQFIISHPHHQPSLIQAILCSASYSLTADVLRLFPSLGIIVTTSVGTEHIDLSECRRRGIQVAGAGNLFAEDVADMAVGLLIVVTRKISAADRYLRNPVGSESLDFPLGSKIGDKRVGIVGLGRIGMEVAKRLEAFGCTILYHSRNKKPFVSYPFYSNVLELAASSNALVLSCELNKQTKHMINREVMLALGKEGVIVNIGRGGLIDEKELVKCLLNGEIGGAGLDVFENEPHVPKELYALDNVVLSPHCAAFTTESIQGMCELVAGNLEAFFSNKPLITPVINA